MKIQFVTRVLCLLGLLTTASQAADEGQPARLMIYDFNAETGLGGWQVEDDVVMGGVSSGKLTMRDDGVAVFSGEVSLDNNGGFSSIQYFFDPIDIDGYETACLKVKGDGRAYQFIVEAESRARHYYSYRFSTGTEWDIIRIPLAELEPYRRGDRMELPNFPGKTLAQVRFLIGNAVAEAFQLEIDAIWLE
ncbi:MAG TPA: CIA30 family protein [Kiritimatiellia bacterium]|nr:CIA30 family protein [Kiritimatiellia bacterium]